MPAGMTPTTVWTSPFNAIVRPTRLGSELKWLRHSRSLITTTRSVPGWSSRGYESTTRKRRNPHRRKQVRRGERCIQAFGIAAAGQVHVHRPEHREVLEHAILRAPIDEVRPGYRNHIEAGCRDRAFANNDEAGDIRVWQRTQQHAVEHAEDRGGGANAERERDDDDRGEGGVFG